jgi:hypothetical protein
MWWGQELMWFVWILGMPLMRGILQMKFLFIILGGKNVPTKLSELSVKLSTSISAILSADTTTPESDTKHTTADVTHTNAEWWNILFCQFAKRG